MPEQEKRYRISVEDMSGGVDPLSGQGRVLMRATLPPHEAVSWLHTATNQVAQEDETGDAWRLLYRMRVAWLEGIDRRERGGA